MNADYLLSCVDKAIEAKQDRTGRKHLGASLIGHDCVRFLWYVFRWADKEEFDGRMLRLFERGQLEETRFIGYLTDAGATVIERDPETGKQWQISDVDGHFGGSTDGVGINIPQLPLGRPAVLEMKTYSNKNFAKLKSGSGGVMKNKPQHYVQLQTYMLKLNIDVGLYMAVNKDTDELYFEFVALDPAVGQRAIARARMIVYADEAPPRLKSSIGWFPCNFCAMKEVCHLTKTPAVNCRTCCHSTPIAGGLWRCAKGRSQITDVPERGCDEHLFNPNMLNIGHVKAGDTAANWITLIRKDGTEVTTGPNHTPSHNLTL